MPPPQRELEIPKGMGGVKEPGNSQTGGGLYEQCSFQRSFDSIRILSVDLAVQKSFLTYQAELSHEK